MEAHIIPNDLHISGSVMRVGWLVGWGHLGCSLSLFIISIFVSVSGWMDGRDGFYYIKIR